MEITEIIKDAFVFPMNNLEKLVIYILVTFVSGILVVGMAVTGVIGFSYNSIYLILTFIFFILSAIVFFIISGYDVSIVKAGIDQSEDAPEFEWAENLVTGIKMLVVNIVYFIIPLVVVIIVALLTNLPGQFMKIAQRASMYPTGVAALPSNLIASLGISIAITATVAVILFVIFAFLQNMGKSRLANTGDLGHALNIPEALKDISRIGVFKVIAVIFITVFIVAVINAIMGFIYGKIPSFSILSVIISPYLAFFLERAAGLLYSDIA